MAWVRPTVEFSPTTNPLDTPVWVDISNDIRGQVSWGYGRGSEFDQANPGQAAFTLDNRTRKYDPHNTAGPYYGNLLPRRKVRITVSGTTCFTGYVTGWNQTADWVNGDAVVEVTAVDPLTVLAQAKLPAELFHHQMNKIGPVLWLRLSDTSEAILRDQRNNLHGYNAGTKYQESLDVWPWDQGRYFITGNVIYISPFNSGINPFGAYTGPSSMGLWVRFPSNYVFDWTTPTAGTTEIALVDHASTSTSRLWVDYLGRINGTGPMLGDAAWHYVVITTSGSTFKIYLDGIELYSTASATLIAGTYTAPFMGWRLGGAHRGIPNTRGFQGWMREFALYDRVLTADEIRTIYESAYGFPVELPGTRVGRVLDLIGWPSAERVIDTGYGLAISQPQELAAGYALSYLQEIAKAEGGLIFAQPDGKVRFRGRHYGNDDTASRTVQATYDDAAAATLRFEKVQPAWDDQYIFNEVTASSEAGPAASLEDTTSIAKYLRRTQDMTGLKTTDAEAYSRAEGVLRRYANPSNARLEEVVINGRYSTAQLNDAIARRIGDRVQVKWKENAQGAQVTYEGHIEAYSHEVDFSELTWRFTFVTQPHDLEPYFKVGTDTLGGAAILGH